MNKLKSEIELNSDLLKLKRLSRDFQQISYSLKKTEDRFSDIELAPPTEMVTYIRNIIAFKFDIKDLLKKWEELYKKYKDVK